MHGKIPAVLHPLLNEYLALLNQHAPGLVTGTYLHGSIALDAFDAVWSDIDCVAFLSRAATTADLAQVRLVHDTLTTRYPAWSLECSYLQWHDLGCVGDAMPRHPIFHDRKFEPEGNFDINPVTWWVLKHRGIALLGPPVGALPFYVDWDRLTRWTLANLNSYWVSFVQKPRNFTWLLTDDGVQWCVLGTLRQYYTFVAHDITSKVGAGDYALRHLPSQWHPIIREALRVRAGAPGGEYSSRVTRAVAAYHFLNFIIQHCNNLPT